MIVYVNTIPRPLSSTRSTSEARQRGQNGPGGSRNLPQFVQRGTAKAMLGGCLPERAGPLLAGDLDMLVRRGLQLHGQPFLRISALIGSLLGPPVTKQVSAPTTWLTASPRI